MNDDEKTAAQGELLFNRLCKRYRHLKKWARRMETNAYRLYDRDIPEIPLVLDLYGDAVSLGLYKRPYEKDEAEEEHWLAAMKASAARALGISEETIFIKQRQRMRQRQDTGAQYGKFSKQNFYRTVEEGDLRFRVNLSDYLDTGLFLDARKKRAIIQSEAKGKRFLNLFAYTCSLSAAAAKGGARAVDSVDLSSTYLEWGKVNFALNKLDLSAGLNFIQSDVFQFIAPAVKKSFRWDIIILDPPSFSNSKRMRGTLDIKRDYLELIKPCLLLLAPGGKLYFSSSAKGFCLDANDFPGFSLKDITPLLIDEDFKGKKTPSCYTLTKDLP